MKDNPDDLKGIALVKVWSEGRFFKIGDVAYFESHLDFNENLVCTLRDSGKRLLAYICKVDAITLRYTKSEKK